MEDWVQRAREGASRATEAAKAGADQAKLQGQGMMLRRRFDAHAKDLGQIVFRQREGEGGLDAEIDRLVGEMRGVRAELDALDS
jgi:hypothetical protein